MGQHRADVAVERHGEGAGIEARRGAGAPGIQHDPELLVRARVAVKAPEALDERLARALVDLLRLRLAHRGPRLRERPPDRGDAERALGAEVLGGIGDESVPEVERDETDHEAKRGLRLPRYASMASRGSPVAKDCPNALTPYSTAVR